MSGDWSKQLDGLNEDQRSLVLQLKAMRDVKLAIGEPRGFVYAGMEDFLLRHGQWYTPTPNTTERRGTPKYCFANSVINAKTAKNMRYVEGVALPESRLLAIHHAWNLAGGEFLDVTWVPVGAAYLGIEFPTSKAWKVVGNGAAMLDNWREGCPLYKKPFGKVQA